MTVGITETITMDRVYSMLRDIKNNTEKTMNLYMEQVTQINMFSSHVYYSNVYYSKGEQLKHKVKCTEQRVLLYERIELVLKAS